FTINQYIVLIFINLKLRIMLHMHKSNVLTHLFFTSRRRNTTSKRDWSSDVCSSDLEIIDLEGKTVMPGLVDVHAHIGNFREGLRSEERRVGNECSDRRGLAHVMNHNRTTITRR